MRADTESMWNILTIEFLTEIRNVLDLNAYSKDIKMI